MNACDTYAVVDPGSTNGSREIILRNYVVDQSTDASYTFMKNTSLGKKVRSRVLKGFIFEWLGNSQHFWMWDYKSIKRELEDAAFCEIRRAQFGDAGDPMFKEVEDSGRWKNCLGVQCGK